MTAPKKQPVLSTPIGVAVYPHLVKPDGKFDPANPKYSTKLRFNVADPEYIAFKKKLEENLAEMIEAFKTENPKLAKRVTIKHELFRPVYDEEGDITDEEEIKGSRKYIMRDKTTNKESRITLDIFDSKKTKIRPAALWGGSKIRLAVRLGMSATGAEVTPFFHIYGVQVIDLVTGGNNSDVFGAVDGGYEGEEDDSSASAFGSEAEDAEEAVTGAKEEF